MSLNIIFSNEIANMNIFIFIHFTNVPELIRNKIFDTKIYNILICFLIKTFAIFITLLIYKTNYNNTIK